MLSPADTFTDTMLRFIYSCDLHYMSEEAPGILLALQGPDEIEWDICMYE